MSDRKVEEVDPKLAHSINYNLSTSDIKVILLRISFAGPSPHATPKSFIKCAFTLPISRL